MLKSQLKWQVLREIIDSLVPQDFKAYLKLDAKVSLTEKHQIVGVIKYLLETAKRKNYNLTIKNGVIYVFNGEMWVSLNKEDLKLFLGKCAEKMGCHETLASLFEFQDKLVKQFFASAHFPQKDVDTSKILINFKNGTLEIIADGTWKLRSFDNKDFLTYQLPFAFDAKAECILFDDFLWTVLPDEASRNLLQEFLGYIFSKENLEKMLMLIGSGANGKSVIFDIVMAIIGKEFVLNFPMGEFKKETNRAVLENILVNYSSEKGTDLNPDTFKALVSSEPVQARNLYGRSFNLYNTARFIINTNILPKETEQTDAYFRRWLILNFDVTIPEEKRDPDLSKKIIASDLPGIFNWILAGLERITKNKRFTYCEKSENHLVEFRRQSDNVALFVEDQVFVKSEIDKIAIGELLRRYRTFCKEDGYFSLGKVNFSKRLEALGFEKVRLNDGSTGFLMEKYIEPEEVTVDPNKPEDLEEVSKDLEL